MATIDLDDDEPVQTTTDRVARAVAPIVESGPKRTLALLAVAAGAGATASSPFDIITAKPLADLFARVTSGKSQAGR